ncbi:MAG TPA: dephospho-CoA kinase [Cytophagales bacterium]|nr:dephospho-CoA kinase [Cytophagales bacterium]
MKPYLLGITGGIGSGKSTISKIFKVLGVKIYQSDDIAKYLMENDNKLISSIINSFGEESYIDGKINKEYISKNVFYDKEKLKIINNLVHPVVINDFKKWCLINKNEKILIKEAALLFESKSYKELDFIIYVYAEKKLRISRILKRDTHRTKDQIEHIIKSQLTDKESFEKADYILENNEKSLLLPEVIDLYEKIRKKAC